MCNWFFKYVEKISRRNARVNGYAWQFLFPRYIKSLILAPTLIIFFGYLFSPKVNTILYRPIKNHRNHINSLNGNFLIIGNFSDWIWARQHGYRFFYFVPFYVACNFGLSIIWRLFVYITSAKRAFVWTDYGLDQYLLLQSESRLKVYCVQHGLFPSTNNADLDGLDSHVNVVASDFQKSILLRAGYLGKVIVFDALFKTYADKDRSVWLSDWKKHGSRVVFVGAGYNHDPEYEDNIVQLINNLNNTISDTLSLVYRPHPRDKAVLEKLKKFKIKIETGDSSSIEQSKNMIFVGVKSTYLLEAQIIGKLSILVLGENFPRYFEPGEIKYELNDSNLQYIFNIIQRYSSR